MLKGKLDWIPEIAFTAVGATIGVFVIRRLLKTDAAAALSRVPVVGTAIAGTQAVMDEAFQG